MITKEENIILNLLLSKRGAVSEPQLLNRKETRAQTYNRLMKQVNETEALRMVKKNLR